MLPPVSQSFPGQETSRSISSKASLAKLPSSPHQLYPGARCRGGPHVLPKPPEPRPVTARVLPAVGSCIPPDEPGEEEEEEWWDPGRLVWAQRLGSRGMGSHAKCWGHAVLCKPSTQTHANLSPTAPRASSSFCSHPPHLPPLLLLPTASSDADPQRLLRQEMSGTDGHIWVSWQHSSWSTKQHPRQTLDEKGVAGAGEGWEPRQKTCGTRGPPTPRLKASSHAEPREAGQPLGNPIPACSCQLTAPGTGQEQQAPEQRSLWNDQSALEMLPSLPLSPPPRSQPPPPLPPRCLPTTKLTTKTPLPSRPASPSAWQPSFRGTQRGLQPQPLCFLPGMGCPSRWPGHGPPAPLQASRWQRTVASGEERTLLPQAIEGLSWRWLQPTPSPRCPTRDMGDSRGSRGPSA